MLFIYIMNNLDLLSLDGKLLATFKAVFETGSVTQAAGQLGSSQSAVSHALDRLRDLFGDPLFVRAGRSIAPTERATALAPAIDDILDRLEQLLAPETFDPAGITSSFSLSANDYERSLLAPALATLVLQHAPKASLKLIDTRGNVSESLRARDCDVVVTPLNPANSYDLFSQPLFQDSYICVFDAKQLTPARVRRDYLNLRHATVRFSQSEPSTIDRILRERGHTRDVAIEAPSFEALPQLIKGTALVATLPSRLSPSFFPGFGSCKFPFGPASLDFHMIWHRTTQDSPKHRWFRALIQEALKMPGA